MHLSLIPTLFLCFGLLSIIYAAGLNYYFRQEDPPAVDHLSMGALAWGISVLLTLFRGELPLLLSYFGANAIAFVANVELNRGLKVIARDAGPLKIRRWLDALFFLLYFGLLYAIHAHAPPEWRELGKTAFVSSAMVIVSVQGARFCFEIARDNRLELARNLGFVFLIVAVTWASRIPIGLLGQGVHAFDVTFLNTLVFLSIFVTGILKYLMFPMLLLQKSERKKQLQFESTLTKLNRTVTSGALSASLAHELNQPLASIHINGQILRKILLEPAGPSSPQDKAQVQHILDDLISDNERAAKIIRSLRAMFRHGHGSVDEIDVGQQIQKLTGLVSQELDRHQIRLDLELGHHLRVRVPEDEFQQVLMNLLYNSMQAMEGARPAQDKLIAIHAWLDNGQLLLTLSDNGPGVSPLLQPQLFQILSTSKDSGMGVGLWLCKYIVERHDGSIVYAHSRLGGATFLISLPLAAPPSQGTGQVDADLNAQAGGERA